jgi:hypothetical protein
VTRSRAATLVILASSLSATSARAGDAELDVATAHADEVSFDVKKREIELRGHVRVDAAPFHLSSEELVVRRGPQGVEVEGKGQMSFCPCAHAPLTIGFDGARVAPPGDVFVDHPTLKVEDTTIFALPWFWLRSPARVGLLPPEIEYRGKESLLLGGGVHVPWDSSGAPREPWPKAEHQPDRLLEVYGAGYVLGGARVRARVLTPQSDMVLTWDDFKGDQGVQVDARGAVSRDDATVAWDVDALHGQRAVTATTELGAAAMPYDRARAETHLREGPLTFGIGAAADSRRGSLALGAYGPRAFVRASGAALALTGSLTADAGALSGSDVRALDGRLGDIAFAHAIADGGAATTLGPLGLSADARADHLLFTDDHQDRDDIIRGRVALPFGRAFGGDGSDAFLHRIEPRLSAAAMSVDAGDTFVAAPVKGEAGVFDAGIATSLGRWAHKDGVDVEGAFGHVLARGGPLDVARWRASASMRYLGAVAEGGHAIANERASALSAGLRIGATDSLHAGVNVAGRSGIDPVAARLLAPRSEETYGGFVASEGWTTGARVSVPIVRPLVVAAYGDYDATSRVLLDVGGSVSLRDSCGCVALRLGVAHRVARDGVDAALTLALSPK